MLQEEKKKYILLEDETLGNGMIGKLYRIQAIKDFGDVKAGDKGGWVEGYHNLSQEGNCWLYDDATAYDNSRVWDDAKMKDDAQLFGNADIHNNVVMEKNARVYDGVTVVDNVLITDDSEIGGDNVWICGNAILRKKAYNDYSHLTIGGNVVIEDDTDSYEPRPIVNELYCYELS